MMAWKKEISSNWLPWEIGVSRLATSIETWFACWKRKFPRVIWVAWKKALKSQCKFQLWTTNKNLEQHLQNLICFCHICLFPPSATATQAWWKLALHHPNVLNFGIKCKTMILGSKTALWLGKKPIKLGRRRSIRLCLCGYMEMVLNSAQTVCCCSVLEVAWMACNKAKHLQVAWSKARLQEVWNKAMLWMLPSMWLAGPRVQPMQTLGQNFLPFCPGVSNPCG